MNFIKDLFSYFQVKQSIIDKNTGTLNLDADVIIHRLITPIHIEKAFGKNSVTLSDKLNGWKSYTVRNFKAGELYFHLIFYFENDILKYVDFVISKTISPAASWDDYDEKQEIQLKKYYNAWVNKQVGSNRKFSWGTIEAFYDMKGGGSSIILTYK